MMNVHSAKNASSVLYGFEFQINVAIYFMLRYLKEISKIRIEGESEDIEIYLKDESKYMIQSKAQTVNLYDNTNNSTNLRKSLESLEMADDDNVKYLFYASNLLNPLNSSTNEFEIYDIVIRKYNELSEESQKKIDYQIAKLEKQQINKDKLVIIRIPFFGEFEDEKYKFIIQTAKDVFSLMGDSIANKSNRIIREIESRFLRNGTEKKEIKITKEEFCNWIILTEIEDCTSLEDSCDIGIDDYDYYEVCEQYKRFIDDKMSSYKDYGKVISLYKIASNNKRVSIKQFVKEKKLDLYNYFFENSIEDENQIGEEERFDLYVAQLISYSILKKNFVINKIKKEACL